MTDLCCQDGRKIFDLFDLFIDHLAADDDMADELALLGVVIAGKCGKLPDLADVVEQGDADKEIPLEERVAFAVKMAELRHTESVFAQAADKSVVNGFRRGGLFEVPDKFGIIDKKHLQEPVEVGVLNGIHKLQDRPEHVVYVAV